ncbi:winged helix-turn-helix transcriptional regulator [Paenibacillus alginolyticus]|uniref:winged helix-turn-helix transcriptional regulator n=1 Tax=Paenibacillus alginolyticus TaxID=59839 RepID=UPI0003FE8A05
MIHQLECPVETIIHVLGGKWKPMILWHLIQSNKRFNDLEKLIPDVSQKMLSQHLRDLEREGIIDRTVYPTVPPKVEYSLSEYGKTLIPVAEVMCAWGENTIISGNMKNLLLKACSIHLHTNSRTHNKSCHGICLAAFAIYSQYSFTIFAVDQLG